MFWNAVQQFNPRLNLSSPPTDTAFIPLRVKLTPQLPTLLRQARQKLRAVQIQNLSCGHVSACVMHLCLPFISIRAREPSLDFSSAIVQVIFPLPIFLQTRPLSINLPSQSNVGNATGTATYRVMLLLWGVARFFCTRAIGPRSDV